MKHLLSLIDWNGKDINNLITDASKIKKNQKKYSGRLANRTMLMLFEKPSLRTRVSFEVGMFQMGGHAIFCDSKSTPLGAKESISDTAKVISRYCDIIVARMFRQEDVEDLARHSSVPVINGLTDVFHPCQILSDLMSINEKKKKLKGLKLCFVGDGNNNITHDLLLGCSAAGMDISVGSPKQALPLNFVAEIAARKSRASGSKIEITSDPKKAAENADIVYADSWMSYHVPAQEKEARIKMMKPYQVNMELMAQAKKDAIFMNCLPAMRGYEQTADVIDGKQSIVFDQAENRLHMQKAIILNLLNKI